MKPFVASGDIAIRHMRDDDDDYLLMSRWLSDERVLEFYEGRDNPHDLAKVRLKYGPRARGQGDPVPCMLVYRGTPVGYIQYYSIEGSSAGKLGIEVTKGIYGVDLFIGLPELWDEGIGTAALSALGGLPFRRYGRPSNCYRPSCFESQGDSMLREVRVQYGRASPRQRASRRRVLGLPADGY